MPDLSRRLGCEGAVSKKFGCKTVDDNRDGLNVYSVVPLGSWSASGMFTGNSETLD